MNVTQVIQKDPPKDEREVSAADTVRSELQSFHKVRITRDVTLIDLHCGERIMGNVCKMGISNFGITQLTFVYIAVINRSE